MYNNDPVKVQRHQQHHETLVATLRFFTSMMENPDSVMMAAYVLNSAVDLLGRIVLPFVDQFEQVTQPVADRLEEAVRRRFSGPRTTAGGPGGPTRRPSSGSGPRTTAGGPGGPTRRPSSGSGPRTTEARNNPKKTPASSSAKTQGGMEHGVKVKNYGNGTYRTASPQET